MFVVPANWPDTRTAHWRALLIARAIENQAFVLGVNRCGSDPALRYPGASMAIDPMGVVLAEADAREQVIRIEIPRRTLDDWRTRFPAWREA
jgi:predicted amidohydrolase